MDIEVLINGECGDKLSVFERTFQFGDGVFETCVIADGVILHWDLHIARLNLGLEKLSINPISEQDLLQQVQKIQRNDGVLKIIISRGQSLRGYRFSKDIKSSCVIVVFKAPVLKSQYQLNICKSGYGHNTNLAGIKHNNRLEQVLASASITHDEGIMLDEDGWVISTTAANIFMIKDGHISTPDLTRCGILGTRRRLILQKNPVAITQISLSTLLSADEIFLSSSILGIKRVIQIEKIKFHTHQATDEIIF
jgi:4-amino-4-deoxychorismate lyase